MAWSQLENVLSSRACQSFLAGGITVCSTPLESLTMQFAEKLLGLWEQRICSVYENYLQTLGFRTGNTVEMAL